MAVGTVSGIEPDDNWQLISTTTISSGTSQYTYSSLSGYKTIMISGRSIVKSAEQFITAQVNGVTTQGAYAGVNNAAEFFYVAPSQAASSGFNIVFYNINQTVPHKVEMTGYGGTGETAYYTNPTEITSIKLYNRDGATFTSGTIYLYGIAA